MPHLPTDATPPDAERVPMSTGALPVEQPQDRPIDRRLPSRRRRLVRWVARPLLWTLALVVTLGGAGAGAVAWAVRDGMLSVAAGSPRAAATRVEPATPARTVRGAGSRRLPKRPAGADSAVRDACFSRPESAADVQRLIETLVDWRAAGVPSDAGETVTVLGLSGELAARFPASASMTTLGDRGLLTWNQENPGNGATVYHELVHLGQFRRGAAAQQGHIDRLEQSDRRRDGFTQRDADDSWKSVHTVISYGQPPADAARLYAAVVERAAELKPSMARTPVARVVRAAQEVLADSSWRSARKRLELVAWLHQGVPPAAPPAGWTWQRELRRLTFFEAEAYAADRRCRAEPVRLVVASE